MSIGPLETAEDILAFTREQTAVRADRLAAFIRRSTASEEQFDAAYAALVKCAGEVRKLLEVKSLHEKSR